MAKSYADLLPFMMGDVGDAHAPVVTQYLQQAVQEFMRISRAWRTTITADMSATGAPSFTLTRPIVTGVTPYAVRADPVLRVTFEKQDIEGYWRVDPPTAAGNAQTLVILEPVSWYTSGALSIRVAWVPMFDAATTTALPEWVFERHGIDIAKWAVGELWMAGHGRKANYAIGRQKRQEAGTAAQRARVTADAEDPLAFQI